jgi:hypothetical protein
LFHSTSTDTKFLNFQVKATNPEKVENNVNKDEDDEEDEEDLLTLVGGKSH